MSEADDPDAPRHYCDAVSGLFEIRLHSVRGGFYNRLEAYHLGQALLARCSGVAQTFIRTRRHLQADGADGVQVLLNRRGGWSGDYDGRIVDGSMGSLRILDMARPFEVRSADFETLNLVVPRRLIDGLGDADIHGLVASEDTPSVKLLIAQMEALWSAMADISAAEADAACRSLAELLVGVALRHGCRALPARRPMNVTLSVMARRMIEEQFSDTELTPERVRHQLGVSRRALYDLFKSEGGVATYIQSRRLDRAFDALVGSGEAGERRHLGFAHGFKSSAHFSRAFKARFGLTPSQVARGQAPMTEPSADAHAAASAVGWVAKLN